MTSPELPIVIGASVFGLMGLVCIGIIAADYLPSSRNVQIKTGWLCLAIGKSGSASFEQLMTGWGKHSQFRYVLRLAISQGYIGEEDRRYYLTELVKQRFERLNALAQRD